MSRPARLTEGKVRIPADVRQEMGLEDGQRFMVIPKGDHLMLVPVSALDDLRGIAKGCDPTGYRDRP